MIFWLIFILAILGLIGYVVQCAKLDRREGRR